MKIILAGGGTGGHLYPALAVADEFKERGVDCEFIGTKRGLESRLVPEYGYRLHTIWARGVAGNLFQKLFAVFLILLGSLQCMFLLGRNRPDLVIGVGGYASAPALFAAKVLGIPLVLLEQNQVAGKVTSLMAPYANLVCLSFPDTKLKGSVKTKWTGNPLRAQLFTHTQEESRKALAIPLEAKVLLVSGASQGAKSLNQAVWSLAEEGLEEHFWVVHLIGRSHFDAFKEQYAELPESTRSRYLIFDFVEDMGQIYRAADLALTRAGATTIAELTALGLPAILVPYPYAGAHQVSNTKALVEVGGAIVVDDSDIQDKLKPLLTELSQDLTQLNRMAEKSSSLGKPDATKTVVEACFEVVTRKERE